MGREEEKERGREREQEAGYLVEWCSTNTNSLAVSQTQAEPRWAQSNKISIAEYCNCETGHLLLPLVDLTKEIVENADYVLKQLID